MQKTKKQIIKKHWKKTAVFLIGLDLCVATGIAVFGGSGQVRSLVFSIFQ